MKTITKIALTAFITFSSSYSYAQWGQTKVEGNGNVTTQTVSTESYMSIKGVGSIDIHLVRGTEGTISVTTDENLHEYVEIDVKHDELIIKVKNKYNLKTKKGIHVTVPFEDISSLAMVGSGDMDTKDTIKTEMFEVSVTGSGTVDVHVDTQTMKAEVTGSGDLRLAGNTHMLDISVTGSGDFNGHHLISNITEAEVSGSGNAEVYAKESVKARVSGSGNISYKGNPERKDIKTAGSGTISSY